MNPSYLSKILRRMAFQIEESQRPDRKSVIRELKRILATLSPNLQSLLSREYDEFVNFVYDQEMGPGPGVGDNAVIPGMEKYYFYCDEEMGDLVHQIMHDNEGEHEVVYQCSPGDFNPVEAASAVQAHESKHSTL